MCPLWKAQKKVGGKSYVDCSEVECDDMNWFELDQDYVRWQTLVMSNLSVLLPQS